MARHKLTTAQVLRLRHELRDLQLEVEHKLQPAEESMRRDLLAAGVDPDRFLSNVLVDGVAVDPASGNQRAASPESSAPDSTEPHLPPEAERLLAEFEAQVARHALVVSRIGSIEEELSSFDEVVELSPTAYSRLTSELGELSTRGRLEVAQRIDEARSLGDLKENGDYHAAKEDQGLLESRIRTLEALLSSAVAIAAVNTDQVRIGTVATLLYDGDPEDAVERFLLGHLEEVPSSDNVTVVSPFSPLGSAIFGARVGQRVEYSAPNGTLGVTVVDISCVE